MSSPLWENLVIDYFNNGSSTPIPCVPFPLTRGRGGNLKEGH